MLHPQAVTQSVPAPFQQMAHWRRSNGGRSGLKKGNPLYHMHRKAIYQQAMQTGAQAGLAWADRVIWHQLQAQKPYLNQVWNFHHWIFTVPDSQHQVWVMPPILEQTQEAIHLHNPDLLTISNKLYRIHAPAKLITSQPRWQGYLMPALPPYPREKNIPSLLLPHTPAQRAAWMDGLKKGWQAGIHLARQNFTEAVYKMRRIFMGILLYDRLHAKNRIGAPYFAISNLGTVDHGRDLRENDRILRITRQAVWHVSGLRAVHHYVLIWNPGLPTQTIQKAGKQ